MGTSNGYGSKKIAIGVAQDLREGETVLIESPWIPYDYWMSNRRRGKRRPKEHTKKRRGRKKKRGEEKSVGVGEEIPRSADTCSP